MRFFWKVYLSSLGFLVLSVALLASVVSCFAKRGLAHDLRTRQRLLATIVASQAEAGYHERIWPFETLAAIAQDPNFLSRAIVDGDGRAVLAHQPREGAPGQLPSRSFAAAARSQPRRPARPRRRGRCGGREAHRHHLQKAGYACAITGNDRAALDHARGQRPLAVVLDLVLPVMDGFEVLKRLKADPLLADIPLIVCSVLAEQERAFALGAMDYIEKPIDGEAPVQKIERIRQWEGGAELPIVALTAHAMKGDEQRCLAAGCTAYLAKPVDPDELAALVARYAPPPQAAAPTRQPTETQAAIQLNLEAIRALSEDLQGEVLAALEATIAELETALDVNDVTTIEALGERLKRSSSDAGLDHLAQSAHRIEAAAGDGDLDALGRLLEALRSHRAQLQGSPG